VPRAGDVIENPVTGETVTFVRTSEDTGGAQLEIELLLRPDAFLPAEHVHPSQEEAFTVLEGAVRFTSGTDVEVVRADRSLVVPSGRRHSWGPDGGAGARVRVVFTPARSTAHFFDTCFALARDGRVNAKGLANPIRMAQMGRTYDVYLGAAPVALQRPVFAALDLVGRLLGYPRMPV
jgi:quercetin dioxygenase-like cupin family protein